MKLELVLLATFACVAFAHNCQDSCNSRCHTHRCRVSCYKECECDSCCSNSSCSASSSCCAQNSSCCSSSCCSQDKSSSCCSSSCCSESSSSSCCSSSCCSCRSSPHHSCCSSKCNEKETETEKETIITKEGSTPSNTNLTITLNNVINTFNRIHNPINVTTVNENDIQILSANKTTCCTISIPVNCTEPGTKECTYEQKTICDSICDENPESEHFPHSYPPSTLNILPRIPYIPPPTPYVPPPTPYIPPPTPYIQPPTPYIPPQTPYIPFAPCQNPPQIPFSPCQYGSQVPFSPCQAPYSFFPCNLNQYAG